MLQERYTVHYNIKRRINLHKITHSNTLIARVLSKTKIDALNYKKTMNTFQLGTRAQKGYYTTEIIKMKAIQQTLFKLLSRMSFGITR